MNSPSKTMTKRKIDVSARLDEAEFQALNHLMQRFRLNKAEALRKAILMAAAGAEIEANFTAAIKGINSIIAGQIALQERQIQSLKYAAQAAIYAGNLAEKEGLKEQSMTAYLNWKSQNFQGENQ